MTLEDWKFVSLDLMGNALGGLDFPCCGICVSPFRTDDYFLGRNRGVSDPLGDELFCATIGSSCVEMANARIPGFVENFKCVLSNCCDGVVVL